MGKPITEELKKQISELYRTSDMTNYEIAKALDVSPRSVRRYKNYGYQEESVQPESYDQDIESHQEIEQKEDQDQDNELEDDEQEAEIIEDYEPSETRTWEYVEVLKCPKCDTPKYEWATIEQALESGFEIPEGYERFYSYVCPNCKTLIPEKRLRVPGVCPECRATSIDWIPSEKSKVSEEIKRISDFICLNCWNPIKISDQ